MKKSIIAGAGVMALAAAAMPFAGVFAANASKTDTINLTIAASCSMTGTADAKTFSADSTGGELAEQSTTVFTVKCNNYNGWSVNYSASALTSATTGESNNIPFGAYPSEESITNKTAASTWSAKAALTGVSTGATLGTGWSNYAQTAATGIAVSATAQTDVATGVVFTPTYKIYVKSGHAAGNDYTGKMVYTFSQENVPAA